VGGRLYTMRLKKWIKTVKQNLKRQKNRNNEANK
jgi:hypothetical protein